VLTSIGVGPARAAGLANDDFYGISFPFVLEDQAFSVAALDGVLRNDSAGPEESICLVSAPTTSAHGGTVSIAPDGSFTYTSPANYAGPDSFTYGIAGVGADVVCPATPDDTAVVSLTVTPVNDAPTIKLVGACADGITVDEDAGYLGEDVCVVMHPGPPNEDAQEATEWVLEINSDVGFITGPTITVEGFLQFRPAANQFGSATLSVRGRDNGGTANGGVDLSDAVQLTITVASVPDAPAAGADAFGALRDRTLNISAPGVLVNDSDGDGDPLTAVLVTAPVHGKLTLAANGSFSYTPASGYVGPDAFSYRASDGGLTSAARVVSLTVAAIPALTPTPAISVAPPSAGPSVEPSVEVTAEPSLGASPSVDPGVSRAPSQAATAAAPSASPEPEPTAGSSGLSLPLLLVVVLFGVLLTFAGAYSIPRWIRARRGEPVDQE
jgi:large repetitive protein